MIFSKSGAVLRGFESDSYLLTPCHNLVIASSVLLFRAEAKALFHRCKRLQIFTHFHRFSSVFCRFHAATTSHSNVFYIFCTDLHEKQGEGRWCRYCVQPRTSYAPRMPSFDIVSEVNS